MKKNALYLILLSLFPVLVSGQTGTEKSAHLKLVFAGDMMGHDTQINSALDKATGTYSYDTCFSLLRSFIESADIAIANLEVTLAGPVYKGYPQFSSPDEFAEAAKKAGFDILINANNHCLDRGRKGLERTIKVLDQKGIIHTGTFTDSSERAKTYPLIVEKNGIRLAILNYTYGTNGLKVRTPNIVNYIDTAVIRQDLQKAKLAEPDFIFVTIHWGIEYQRQENREQEKLATFMLKHGADAIIGSHPHVVQPIREYGDTTVKPFNGNLVVYSLGNFISNQRKQYTDGGIMVEVDLEKTRDKTRLSGYSYLPVWVWKPLKKEGGNYFVLVPANTGREDLLALKMAEKDRELMKLFYKDTSGHLGDTPINPYRADIKKPGHHEDETPEVQ